MVINLGIPIAFIRFIFVNELNEGSVNAYTRNEDHTLSLNQVCIAALTNFSPDLLYK